MKPLRWLRGVTVLVLLTLAIGIALSWAPERSVASLTPRWAAAPSQFLSLIHI